MALRQTRIVRLPNGGSKAIHTEFVFLGSVVEGPRGPRLRLESAVVDTHSAGHVGVYAIDSCWSAFLPFVQGPAGLRVEDLDEAGPLMAPLMTVLNLVGPRTVEVWDDHISFLGGRWDVHTFPDGRGHFGRFRSTSGVLKETITLQGQGPIGFFKGPLERYHLQLGVDLAWGTVVPERQVLIAGFSVVEVTGVGPRLFEAIAAALGVVPGGLEADIVISVDPTPGVDPNCSYCSLCGVVLTECDYQLCEFCHDVANSETDSEDMMDLVSEDGTGVSYPVEGYVREAVFVEPEMTSFPGVSFSRHWVGRR